MGNKNDKNPKTTAIPGWQPRPVPNSPYRNYPPLVTTNNRTNNPSIQPRSGPIQGSVTPLSSRMKQTTPMVPDQPSARNVNKQNPTPTSSKIPVTLVPIPDQSFHILGQNSPPSVAEKQRMPSTSHNTPLSHTTITNTVTASSLEKAPPIKLNYVAKSTDFNTLNTYRLDNITVIHRSSSQSVPYGNRWYDNDYNRNVKPLFNKYL